MSVWDEDEFEGFWLGFVFDWKRRFRLPRGSGEDARRHESDPRGTATALICLAGVSPYTDETQERPAGVAHLGFQNLEFGREKRESTSFGSYYGRTYGHGIAATASRPSPSEGHA